jgi:hypothetical protein
VNNPAPFSFRLMFDESFYLILNLHSPFRETLALVLEDCYTINVLKYRRKKYFAPAIFYIKTGARVQGRTLRTVNGTT